MTGSLATSALALFVTVAVTSPVLAE
jgi:hypothetical protein